MNFLSAVTRVMRINGIIRGDTDAPTTFSDLQHGATIQIAQIAIQDELNELVADTVIPYEHKGTGTITTVAGTRSYSLASDFVRFYGTPSLYEASANGRIYEIAGGEAALMNADFQYKTTQTNPIGFYFDQTTTKKLAFYPVPSEAKTYTYDYEYDVSVTNSTDTIPFHTESEAQAFCRMAARRFKYLYESVDMNGLTQDTERTAAKSTLINLLKGRPAPKQYAAVYR